jgi:hypothetical protein
LTREAEGPYRDFQPHLYWVDTQTARVEQSSKDLLESKESLESAIEWIFSP